MYVVFAIWQVGLLNVEGFYDSLLLFIDMAVAEGFISEAARHIIISASSAKELVGKLEVVSSIDRSMTLINNSNKKLVIQ